MGIKQYELAYQRLKENYAEALAANKTLGDRTAVIVGGGTALATFFGASQVFAINNPNGFLLLMLSISAVASLLGFIAASYIWLPMDSKLPGSTEESKIWSSIIEQEEEEAMANMIADISVSIERELENNTSKAKAFRYMLICVWIQVIAILVSVWAR